MLIDTSSCSNKNIKFWWNGSTVISSALRAVESDSTPKGSVSVTMRRRSEDGGEGDIEEEGRARGGT